MKMAVFMAAFFILLVCGTIYGQSQSRLAFKGIWIIRHNLTSAKKIRDFVHFAAQYGFTDIFVQVRGRGDAFYKSEIVSPAESLTDNDFDPLSLVLSEAHKRNIRVHAWLNMYFLWSAKNPPKSPSHLLYKHPDWIATNSDGVSDFQQNWRDLIRNGFEGIYLSPVHPEVNKYLCSIVEELLTKYDLDGIHLDYIRFQSIDYGYNPVARDSFREQYGIDPILLTITDKFLFKGFDSLQFDRARKEWNNFRREGVTSLVKCIRNQIYRLKPSVFLSVAAKADIHAAREFYLQDWVKWADEGILDFVVPMNYVSDNYTFVKNLTKIREKLPSFPVYVGIGAYNQDKYSAASKISLSRKYGFNGIVIFSYDTYLKSKSAFDLFYKAMN